MEQLNFIHVTEKVPVLVHAWSLKFCYFLLHSRDKKITGVRTVYLFVEIDGNMDLSGR
jgi:hypothetical protein